MKKINWRQMVQNFATRAKKLFPYAKVPIRAALRTAKKVLQLIPGMGGNVLQLIGRCWYYLWSMRKVLAVLLLILLAYKLYYEEREIKQFNSAATQKNATNPEYDLVTTKISVGEISDFVKTSGKLAPEQEVKVILLLQKTLPILKVNVQYGDTVEAGQILLELDSSEISKELEVMQKRVEIRSKELALKEDVVTSNKILLEKGYISKTEYLDSETNYNNKMIEVEEAKRQVNKLEEQLLKSRILAPIRGRIDYVNEQAIENGIIGFNTWVYTVSSSADRLKLSLSVDGRAITKIKEGQDVTFRIDTHPNKDLFGTVIKIIEPLNLNPHRDKAPVFYEIIADVGETPLELKAGMSVDASIKIQTKTNIKRVPRSALRFVPPKIMKIKDEPPPNTTAPVIWIVNKDGTISAITIETGIRDNAFVELLTGSPDSSKNGFYNLTEKDDIVIDVRIHQQQKKKSRFSLPQPKRY